MLPQGSMAELYFWSYWSILGPTSSYLVTQDVNMLNYSNTPMGDGTQTSFSITNFGRFLYVLIWVQLR